MKNQKTKVQNQPITTCHSRPRFHEGKLQRESRLSLLSLRGVCLRRTTWQSCCRGLIHQARAGFTLIELTIAILIIGFFFL